MVFMRITFKKVRGVSGLSDEQPDSGTSRPDLGRSAYVPCISERPELAESAGQRLLSVGHDTVGRLELRHRDRFRCLAPVIESCEALKDLTHVAVFVTKLAKYAFARGVDDAFGFVGLRDCGF